MNVPQREYTFIDQRSLPVGTIFCIGRNYASHAREMSAPLPAEPLVFLKPPQAYVPHGGVVRRPQWSTQLNYEVELVVVMGRDAEDVSAAEAHKYIAGYAVGLDMTLRDVQSEAKKRGEPWARAKSFATSAPISAVVPASRFESSTPHFELRLLVNGTIRQSGATLQMERSVPVLVEYLSQVYGLRAGDCIFTGTPEGVGVVEPGETLEAHLLVGVETACSLSATIEVKA